MSSSAIQFSCFSSQHWKTPQKKQRSHHLYFKRQRISSSMVNKTDNSRNIRKTHQRKYLNSVGNSSILSKWALNEVGFMLGLMDFTNADECTRTYAFIFQKCRKLSDLNLGFQVHAHMIISGVDLCAFLGSQVIELYAKYLCVDESRKVFEKMSERNVFCWNSMMGMYNKLGDYEETVNLFYLMVEEGVRPDHFIFPKVFKACSEMKDYRVGKNVYHHMVSIGFEGNGCVKGSLLDMFAKCGRMDEAVKFFEQMEFRDVFMWNIMISGYASEGKFEKALKCVEEMKVGDVMPDQVTWNSVIAGYAQHGKLKEASAYFTCMNGSKNFKPNVISWTTLIAGYEQHGYVSEALNLFRHMVKQGVRPTSVTIASLVSACTNLSLHWHGKEIHCYCIKTGELDSDLLVNNSLIDYYAKCHSLNAARRKFDTTKKKDLISWNTMLAGYANKGCCKETIKLLTDMESDGVKPDVVTWNGLISGYTQSGEGEMAIDLFHRISERGLDPNSTTISGILAACSQVKDIRLGKEIHAYVMRNHIELSTGVGSALISMYSACYSFRSALAVFKELSMRDIVIWNSIIASCTQNRRATDALSLLRDMVRDNTEPDSVTMVSVLPACSRLAALRQGKEIHQFIIRRGLDRSNFVMNALVDMYGRCGSVHNSRRVYESIPFKDLVTWNVMISVYGMHGLGKYAIDIFQHLRAKELKPNHVTFTNLLSACSHSGLVEEGWKYFEMMKKDYALEPAIEQCCCMVDLMGRAGQFDKAIDFIEKMPVEPNSAVWGSLLGSCRIHNNPEIAEYAARHLFELEPQISGNYILLANIYSAAGRWEDSARVWRLMKEKGVAKQSPGCSWIEVERKVHSFIVGDISNPLMNEISVKLNSLYKKIKENGYVPDTAYVLQKVEEDKKEQSLCGHSEKLALVCGLISTPAGTPLRIIKNLRICGDCHSATKYISKVEKREIIMRDNYRFHHFVDGVCSCGDYW